MKFKAKGHKNILANHHATLEFTKDRDVTIRGTCILGVDADFDFEELKKLVNEKARIKIVIKAGELTEEVNAEVNKEFDDNKEIVVRRTDFASKRTLGIYADKACIDFPKEFREKLKNPEQEIIVNIE